MNTFKIISYFKNENKQITRGIAAVNQIKKFDNSKNYNDVVDIFNKLTNIYCNKHNYKFEFKYITDADLLPIINNKKQFKLLSSLTEEQERFENIVLYKLLMTKNALDQNDSEYVVFLDPDAIISNPNIKLDNFIDNEHEIWLSPGNHEYNVRSVFKDLINNINILFNNQNYLNDIFKNIKSGYDKFYQDKNIDLNGLFKQLNSSNAAFNEGFFIVKNTEKMRRIV